MAVINGLVHWCTKNGGIGCQTMPELDICESRCNHHLIIKFRYPALKPYLYFCLFLLNRPDLNMAYTLAYRHAINHLRGDPTWKF
ncbi:hypothetical protein AGR7C_pTi0218 [Agrobacterium deltaense Zutra 3/1]|uniref:Uncharacterized protein n=1 Tax=Agrobacterium deltaense Zutra 3/1 TaxID=1183427 RepID=A0A1S7S823_9HYPH|nr:hypothetical protein AGR7C_pTi0218 [Agrobacterium deltaense Zutra 3/1]